MIKLIIDLLPYVEPTTEALKQAKGAYYLPTTFKELRKLWQRKAL